VLEGIARSCDCMLFVLKTTALTPFPQGHDLLSIVLWQVITVQQQEPLRRLNVLQVSKSRIVSRRVVSCIFSFVLPHRIKQPLFGSLSPGKYSAAQGASLDTTCSGCPAGNWDAHHSLVLHITVNEFIRCSVSQAETSASLLLHTISFLSFS
jgi:hypothetical protein